MPVQRRGMADDKNSNSSAKKQRNANRKAAEKADNLIRAGKDQQALNYLKLAKRADRASDALEKAMGSRTPKCADNPGPYIDYDEDNPPSKEEAYKLCRSCPVLMECARFANALRPEVGVWGGEVYQAGKIIHK